MPAATQLRRRRSSVRGRRAKRIRMERRRIRMKLVKRIRSCQSWI